MEASAWGKRASLYAGPRAVGGRVSTPPGRLVFTPHALDRALAGRSLDVSLDSISRLTLTTRSWFAPRRHVLVETDDGVRARFLVNGARGVIEHLAQAARAAGREPDVRL